MPELLVHTTATEEWLSLVHEAETAAAHPLDEEMQSYLEFLLMRFTENPELAASILAVEYLQSMHTTGRIGQDQLRNVGDKCLLSDTYLDILMRLESCQSFWSPET